MNQPCFIELLGGVQVRQGERTISRFRTQKTAALLAYLGYFLKRTHPREELIEMLWPETDPQDSRASLRTALSSLRRQLEPPGTPYNSVLITDRANVRLNPEAVSTDVDLFLACLQSASRLEETAGRAHALSQAIELYRGPLLPGFYEEWSLRERERLEQRYLTALGELGELLEKQGERGQAIEMARRRVHLDPFMEEARCDLIRLLIATGQINAAHTQYEEMERLLRDEFDTAPSPAAQALAAQLSQVAPKSTGARATTLPPLPPATPLPISTPALPAAPVSPAATPRLPLHLTPFFGREEEGARLRELLGIQDDRPTDDQRPTPQTPEDPIPRLITLTGPGGTGKTRLAVEAVRSIAEAYGGRIWFVPLADLTDADLMYDALLSALHLPRSTTQEPLEQIAQTLGQAASLLLLDNFEQLVESGAPRVWTLLERIPTLTCLLTSRQRLDLAGEREFPVPPLPVPSIPGTPERLMKFASVRLFVERAQAARSDFQITRENAPAIAALCERLEGIPLAIELAAAWAALLTPSQMLTRLDDRFAFLASRRKNLSARHRTLRDAIEWSYRLLTPELQRVFVRLAVFRGGWTLHSAEAICEEPQALELLQQLQERSLIVTEESEAEMRFRLLETLREYAWERLVEQGDEQTVRQLHRDYYLALAEASGPKLRGQEQAATLAMLEREHDNLRAALDWCQRKEDAQPATDNEGKTHSSSGLRLAVALSPFWEVRGYLSEGRRWLEALMERNRDASVSWRAKALDQAGTLAWHQGHYATARAFFEESLALFRQSEDKQGIADILRGLGILAEEQGEYEAAKAFLEESLALKREQGDRGGLAASLNTLANVISNRGEYASARALYEESLLIRRELEDMRGIAAVLSNLGLMLYEQADYAAARPLHGEGLALHRLLGDKRGIAASLNNLAVTAHAVGDYPEARTLYEESLGIRRELGDQRGIATSLNNLGELARQDGEMTAAHALYEEALTIRRQLGDRRGVASTLAHLGSLTEQEGDSLSARAFYVESLMIRRDLEDKRGIAECLENLAGLAAGRGEARQAAGLYGAAESLRESIDAPLPPLEQMAYDQKRDALRSQLSEEEFTTAWKNGQARTLEQAIEAALKEDK